MCVSVAAFLLCFLIYFSAPFLDVVLFFVALFCPKFSALSSFLATCVGPLYLCIVNSRVASLYHDPPVNFNFRVTYSLHFSVSLKVSFYVSFLFHFMFHECYIAYMARVCERHIMCTVLRFMCAAAFVRRQVIGTLQYGSTALIWAAEKGFVDCVRLLIDAGANKDAKGSVRLRPLDFRCNSSAVEMPHDVSL